MPQRRRTTQPIQVRARQLRQEQTAAEAHLWEHLRDRRLGGFKFRRQHPLGRFIVDFYCAERRLIVEVDGSIHDQQHEHDQAREEALKIHGYSIVRITNTEIATDLPNVLQRLLTQLHNSQASDELKET